MRGELGLWLLQRTGRRRTAVMGLHWSDVDFNLRRVTWRAAKDKAGRTRVVRYPPEFIDTMRKYLHDLGSPTGFFFPKAGNPNKATNPELLSDWIDKAEKHAGLSKLKQGGTHPYRRAWASTRRHLPLKLRMEAGGWSDPSTMLRCYDQPDEMELLEVTSISWDQPPPSSDSATQAA